MKKYLLIVLVVSVLSALNAKIIETRTFDVIEFNDGRMTNKSKNYFKAIVGTIKSYIENKKNIRIQVIGYTRTEVDRHEELKVNSDSYSIQHDFSFVESKDEAEESTTIYASYVVGKLEKNKIPKNLITKEFHNFKLLGYTSIKDKEKGLDLPNRVTITMHVLKRKSNKKVLPKVVVPVVVVEKKVEKVIVPSVVVPAVVAEKKVEKVVVPAVIVPAAVVEKKVEKAIVPTVIIPAVVVEKKVEKVVVPTEVVEKKVEKEDRKSVV